MKQRIRVIVLVGAIFALASCQNFTNFFGRSMDSTTPDKITAESPAAEAADVDESRIRGVKADNARLQRQLSAALRENAKLKRDLAELRDDNSLLKDLAAKKQR
jgi:hypothetical protein